MESVCTQERGTLVPVGLLYLTHDVSARDLAFMPLQLWPLGRVKSALPRSGAEACCGMTPALHCVTRGGWLSSLVTLVSQRAYIV